MAFSSLSVQFFFIGVLFRIWSMFPTQYYDDDIAERSITFLNLTENESYAAYPKQTRFAKLVVERHNMYRAKHRAPNLTYNDQLSKISQVWANTLASHDILLTRPINRYGENVFVFNPRNTNNKVSPYTAVDSWYAESKDYLYVGEKIEVSAIGHFSQVVWKNSKLIGVGKATNKKSGNVYVVCNYTPPGNKIDEFKDNVLKP